MERPMPSKPVVIKATSIWITITIYSMDVGVKILEELPHFGRVVKYNENTWDLYPSEGYKNRSEEIVNYLQSLIDN